MLSLDLVDCISIVVLSSGKFPYIICLCSYVISCSRAVAFPKHSTPPVFQHTDIHTRWATKGWKKKLSFLDTVGHCSQKLRVRSDSRAKQTSCNISAGLCPCLSPSQQCYFTPSLLQLWHVCLSTDLLSPLDWPWVVSPAPGVSFLLVYWLELVYWPVSCTPVPTGGSREGRWAGVHPPHSCGVCKPHISPALPSHHTLIQKAKDTSAIPKIDVWGDNNNRQ